jgi:glutamate-5-semialdehyde dehydrogenase
VKAVLEQCRNARAAARAFASSAHAHTARKNALLAAIARDLRLQCAAILHANAGDLEAARASGTSAPMLARLALDEPLVTLLADSVASVIALPDPVGQTITHEVRPSGISVRRVRVPLGVIAMVYESRPNVTLDASILALKTGNALVLRGGSEARRTNEVLTGVVRQALVHEGYSEDTVQLLDNQDRSAIRELVRAHAYVDLAIPRGGEALIREVVENATVPVVQHYKGVCHLYVDAGADIALTERLVLNAKMQRPSACNALECLLVHAATPSQELSKVLTALQSAGCEIRACDRVRARVPGLTLTPASPDDFGREFLAPILAVKLVGDLDEAIAHIAVYGSRHTEAIVSPDSANVLRFQAEVDAACVVANASTRFHDGGELGLGAEIGIATSRLHWRGPMGLESLTTMKWQVTGNGETRA